MGFLENLIKFCLHPRRYIFKPKKIYNSKEFRKALKDVTESRYKSEAPILDWFSSNIEVIIFVIWIIPLNFLVLGKMDEAVEAIAASSNGLTSTAVLFYKLIHLGVWIFTFWLLYHFYKRNYWKDIGLA